MFLIPGAAFLSEIAAPPREFYTACDWSFQIVTENMVLLQPLAFLFIFP